jgi:diguanylate cyclase (GGDEF)-like protein/PAS domain S-box-containing protein
MKNKILISLFAIFLFFSLGATFAVIYITNTTSEVKNIVELHEVEELRRSLIIDVQSVQTNLYTFNTSYASDMDSIIASAGKMDDTATQCTSCHHNPRLTSRILTLQSLIEDYKRSLSYFMTTSANSKRTDELKDETVAIGNEIIARAEEMSHSATGNLQKKTEMAMVDIYHVKDILLITLLVTFFLSVLVAIRLITSVTRPVRALVSATRKVSSGEYGTTISYSDKTEFGELAKNFNVMSRAVQKGYETINREIAERRQTEEALVSSEKFLNTIFDSILDPFCIIDRDFRVVRVNEAYSEIKEKSTSDITERKCYEIFEGQNRVCKECIVARTFQSLNPCAKSKQVEYDDGTKIWLDIYTYPIFDEEGKVSHVIEYIRDITDRQLAEDAVRESEERYMLSAKGANDGLWDWDMKSNKICYSSRWMTMLGYEEGEISAGPEEWLDRIHHDDRMQVKAEISAHISGHTTHFKSEHRIKHRDGTYRWVLSRGLAIRDVNVNSYRMAGSMTDITERKKAEKQLIFDALHDGLTGLPNRALFMDRLGHAVSREKRNKEHLFAVCFLDMDRFKVLNDSLGHTVGDKLLVAISERLEESLRPDDTVARLGGDEFAMLLEDLKNSNEALSIIERIQEKFVQPFGLDGQEVFASASIGIAFSSTGYDNPEGLLRDADIAMYHAKSKGSACYQVFDNNMYDNAVARMQMETDLRHAVMQNEFSLYYQPIVSAKSGRITGLEALIRWNHPQKGLIPPLEFIPTTEETGLIVPLGDWIIEEACKQLSIWQKQFVDDDPLSVSVNISSKQLTPRFIGYVKELLGKVDLAPNSLVLEITESIIMENAEIVAPLLQQLKEMDVQLHIDDFGTGYSSLSYLHRFPLDVLKIDRSFVNRIDAKGDNLEIIIAITTLAHNLEMEVVVEGVETEEQLKKLKAIECEYMQGFYFSKPLEKEQMEFLLKKSHFDIMTYLTHPSNN